MLSFYCAFVAFVLSVGQAVFLGLLVTFASATRGCLAVSQKANENPDKP